MATFPLPTLPPTQRLSPLVVRVLGGNPSKFTLQGTNTYLVGRGRTRTLIDTGEGNRIWPATLRQALEDENATIDRVLLTHWHPDHVGGVPDVLALHPGAEVCKNQSRPEDTGAGWKGIEDGQVFRAEGATLRALHTPGHAVDHMVFLLEEEGAMFTGDNVLGHGTAVFEDLAVYVQSLERMKAVQEFVGRAYPGHGEVVNDGRGKVAEYIAHRKEREEQVLALLATQRSERQGEGWGSMEMVKVIYKDYPASLHGPAEGGLMQVLRKLEGEGRVRKSTDGAWSLVSETAAL